MATTGDISTWYNSYITQGNTLTSTSTSLTDDIEIKNSLLTEKQTRQTQQLAEIEEKNKLILTRSRMLQLSQERNIFKKKIIYTLIAVILLLLIITLATYVSLSKKN